MFLPCRCPLPNLPAVFLALPNKEVRALPPPNSRPKLPHTTSPHWLSNSCIASTLPQSSVSGTASHLATPWWCYACMDSMTRERETEKGPSYRQQGERCSLCVCLWPDEESQVRRMYLWRKRPRDTARWREREDTGIERTGGREERWGKKGYWFPP